MAMTTSTTTLVDELETDQCVAFGGIGWDGYETLLKLRGERSGPRMVYLDGDAHLMSPSYTHEHSEFRLGIFISEVITELNIPCIASGSTTFRREFTEAGAEPDLSYYFANLERFRSRTKTDIRLDVDPPPDLAVEVVWTHVAEHVVEVYRRFGVPEVWIYEKERLRILILGDQGQYVESPSSAAFPFLTADEVADWIRRPRGDSDTPWLRDLRRWVREVLAPRVAANPNP